MQDQMRVKDSLIRLFLGDITELEVDAFVYYARHDLALGSGFGGAIAVRGGPSIAEELKRYGPVETTAAVTTSAGNLKAKQIIHAVGPRFQEPDLERKLQTTIRNILLLADDKKISRLAFPAMGAGFYGVPLDICSKTMFDVIIEYLHGETGIGEVIICLNDSREYKPFQAGLKSLASSLETDPVRRSEVAA